MQLVTMTAADAELRVRMETDPAMMAELGGPRPRVAIERAHAGSLVQAAAGDCWPLKVNLEDGGPAVGSVVVWLASHDSEALYEIGWMILPEFQGRGIASVAVHDALAIVRATERVDAVHAYPGATNVPSNRVCEKNGFTILGTCNVEFGGHTLRCNHWRLGLR
ncbi:MAG: GNAT family N-acetyltransferase [Candidatus Dormiibacterota bacterium]